ncbi:LytR C-terminal domain-containing protein [Streptomyces sp. RFCAC02]|uniref:LytR C-terminal domain-containing protein n=1 Tax=Streptomyces sp. RFCAC02 TaxID=2499143 RepID=UPI001021354A|nr:LytR C-terminal domain-containing protein [Streptomyces sp. RFCAC02]
MSMLTPPGMGGKKFRITGDRYPRMRRPRRRRRAALAVFAVVTVLGLLGYGTLQLIDVFTGDGDRPAGAGTRNAAGRQDCAGGGTDTRVDLPKPDTITVNVYNATTRTGLAQATADALAERGFSIGEVENAPADLDGQVDATALLLGTAAAEESGALTVLGAQVEDAETGTPESGERADNPAVVDFVIGDGFTELAAADEAEQRLADLASPSAEPAGDDASSPPAC